MDSFIQLIVTFLDNNTLITTWGTNSYAFVSCPILLCQINNIFAMLPGFPQLKVTMGAFERPRRCRHGRPANTWLQTIEEDLRSPATQQCAARGRLYATLAQHVRPLGICCCWPDDLRDPTVNTTTFRRLLKTHFSWAVYTSSALKVKT